MCKIGLEIELPEKSAKFNNSGSVVDKFKGVVNCQNSRDKGPPEGNSARG